LKANPIYIQGGRLVDPAAGRDEVGDLFVSGGRIAPLPAALPAEATRIDATGLIVTPGLVDLHVHLREPGGEAAETIQSGSTAAARGGFTTIVAMPNTHPPVDSASRVAWCKARAEAAPVAVQPTGCITAGRAGRAVADFAAMREAGAVAFTDDGCTVGCDAVMRQAMMRARAMDALLMDHAQDTALERAGVMHDGEHAERLCLPGIPSWAEEKVIRRDIELAEATGCRLHIQHVTTREGVAHIRAARERGVAVSGEVTPHHLALTDADVDPDNADFKMNPPLRSSADRDALRAAVAEGTLQAFATDHAPHLSQAKASGFLDAPFGVVGLETAVGVTYRCMVESGAMDLTSWVARWTVGPMQVLGAPLPTLDVGARADIALLDLETEWRVDSEQFASRSRNTPFSGRCVKGYAACTIRNGVVVWRAFARVP